MPRYEYFCDACKKAFSKILTPAEYAEGTVVCPLPKVKREWEYGGNRVPGLAD